LNAAGSILQPGLVDDSPLQGKNVRHKPRFLHNDNENIRGVEM